METRYILIRKAGDNSAVAWSTPSHSDTARKRSACFAISNEPGGLWKLLSVYALRGLNVFKVEARPPASRAPAGFPEGTAAAASNPMLVAGGTRLWDHIFYVDYVVPPGQTQEEADRIWAAACEFSKWQRDFGTYCSLVSSAEKKAQTFDQMYQ